MEIGEIITYVVTALGGGGAGWLVNWKWGRRKEAASVKADEIENMKKAMEDFYDPLVKKQNERIAELEGEVKALREKLSIERDEHQAQIIALQKQVAELYKALGLKVVKQVRNSKGQFTSETVEEPVDES